MGPDLCKDQRKHCRAQLGGIFRRTPASPRAEGFFGAPQLPPGEGRQALLWNAHAGSRTRVTSMGGLYDAATLRALTTVAQETIGVVGGSGSAGELYGGDRGQRQCFSVVLR